MQRSNIPVSKIPFLGMNFDDPDFSIKPGFYRRADNMLPDVGSGFVMNNIPAFKLRDNGSLPVGTNTCVFAFEDRENNKLVYFIQNSNNNHGIWKFDPSTNIHTLILQNSVLNFSGIIHSAGIIRNLLYWVDGDVVHYIDMTNPPTGTIVDKRISLDRVRPMVPPDPTLGSDATKKNNIGKDSHQFVTRFRYSNNEYSLFSPVSKLIPALQSPNVYLTSSNKITVVQSVDTDIKDDIAAIEFAVIKNNEKRYRIFNSTNATGASSYSVTYFGNEFTEDAPDEDLLNVNLVPRNSDNLCVKDDRVFLTQDLDNHEDEGNFTLSLANTDSGTGSIFHLDECLYEYGVVCFDGYGKTNGVLGEKSVAIPAKTLIGTASHVSIMTNPGYSNTGVVKPAVNWTLSGTPPSWAKYYSIVMKKNQTIESFFGCTAVALFYKKEGTTAGAGEVSFNGKIYHSTLQNGWSSKPIHLKVPQNLPFVLDGSYKVKVMTSGFSSIPGTIKRVVGDVVEIDGNLGMANWNTYGFADIYVMFYKERASTDPAYYEIGQQYPITAGAFSVTSGQSAGDVHGISMRQQLFLQPDSGNFASGYAFGLPSTDNDGKVSYVFSQSPTTSTVTLERITETSRVPELTEDLADIVVGGGLLFKKQKKAEKKAAEGPIVTSEAEKILSADYNKIASHFGRAFVVIRNKEETQDHNTIGFSNPYVVGSKINGTHRFNDLNQYTIPLDRSRLRKLVAVSSSGVMLAIHERQTTSLYVGEAFINTADAQEILTKVEGVLTKQGDRLLTGGYGTINPESVVEHNGSVYWFDAYKGEVVRYSRAGLTPIGSVYAMSSYFREKAAGVLANGGNVLGGFDPYLKMYFLTFVDDGETIAFQDVEGRERWVGFYNESIGVPDYYAKVNNKFFTFKDGKIYEMNVEDTTWNTGYSSNFSSKITQVFKEDYSKDKILRNVSIESDSDDWFIPSCTNIAGQDTELEITHFKRLGEVSYADWLRDKNTNPALLTGSQIAIRHGKEMKGKSFDVTFENQITNAKVQLEAINVGFVYSSGHRTV